MDDMEGVVSMVVYLITGMMILMLVGGIVWSLYSMDSSRYMYVGISSRCSVWNLYGNMGNI